MALTHYLQPLLSPGTVALCGASERPGSLGRIVYENLLNGPFRGELYAVNPAHRALLGRPAFASLTAIARPIDLAAICAPPPAVPGILAECRGRVRGAVVMSGAPTAPAVTYARWRREIASAARTAKLPLLGPASFGVVRTSSGLNATYGSIAALPGRLTLISQSGTVASALLDFASTAGIGFASVVVLGAAADVDIGEVLDFALADAETDSILLYLETLREARPLMSALRAAARTKPVVVLKAGRYFAADGDVPAPDQVFDAALKRAGTVRVHSYTQLFAAARLLATGRIPRGNRLAIVTNGRGPGLLAADCARDLGVPLARFSDATRTRLAPLLPTNVKPVNPVDVSGEALPERFGAAVEAVLDDATTDGVLALHVTVPAAPPTDTARAVAAAAKNAGKPVLAAWLGSVDRPETRAALETSGIADFFTPENAVQAFSFLASYRRNQEWLLEAPPSQLEIEAPDLALAARVRVQAIAARRATLTAGETRRLLAAFGITMVPHALRRRSTKRSPAGGEMKVAIATDRVFGPVIALGASAAKAGELSLMLPPLNRKLASDLIAVAAPSSLRARDAPLQSLLLRVSALACALPWVVKLELDPVRIAASGALVAGARVVIGLRTPASAGGYRHMAIHPYPVELETTLSLRDGTRLRVRPIRPEDADRERAFVAGLSDESRYLRFMQHLPQLTPRMLARFTQVDYDRELALIALDRARGKERIIAVARYVGNPDRESAEFAIVVADAWHGRGVGRALMQLLIACAKRRGFSRLVGNVLTINKSMLDFVSGLGFHREKDPDDPEQVIVTLELGPRKQ
ncbi:MAG TPA: GNAT family N-acetyltransferase [Casimicrobiaceae bacterium]|nr:GNAT family N-acetyltransferase [Casimicrobiaceae bacterium]